MKYIHYIVDMRDMALLQAHGSPFDIGLSHNPAVLVSLLVYNNHLTEEPSLRVIIDHGNIAYVHWLVHDFHIGS